MKKLLIVASILVLAGAAAGGFWFFTLTPQTNVTWSPDESKTVTATTATDGTITLHNVRDWTYGDGTVTSENWHDVSEKPTDVTSLWFVMEPFTWNGLIGHTLLSFEFKDGTVLSYSIEARLKDGEMYSGIRSTFRGNILSYEWGTERDYLSRRVLLLGHHVYLYKVSVSPEIAQHLFSTFVAQTNDLAAHPRFYNTIFANCTNILAEVVNNQYPHTLPFDISWELTGLSDAYLMHLGFIPLVHTSVSDTQKAADLSTYREQVLQSATSSPIEFSAKIRSLISTH